MADFLAFLLQKVAILSASGSIALFGATYVSTPGVPEVQVRVPNIVETALLESPDMAQGAAEAQQEEIPNSTTNDSDPPSLDPQPALDGLLSQTAAVAAILDDTASTTVETFPYPPGFDDARIKAAVVNIVCLSYKAGIPSMSGSGVVIDPKGIILTNAHVGQYFLLSKYIAEGDVSCIVRGGNPAVSLYKADLLHISDTWIKENTLKIMGKMSQGTGENDYALLRITVSATKNPLPAVFSFLPFTVSRLRINDPVVVTAYPAEYIPNSDISKKLYALSAPTEVFKAYTFEKTTTDLVGVYGTFIAQKGTSGGALVNEKGELSGIIATASEKMYDGSRRLYAITIDYVSRSLKAEAKQTLTELISGDVEGKAAAFQKDKAAHLEAILVNAIENRATSTPQ